MVTKEQIEERIEEARRWVASGDELAMTNSDQVIVAIAGERDRLAASAEKMVALLSDPEVGNGCWATNDGMRNAETCDGQYNEDGEVTAPVCWQHRCWALLDARAKEGT
jgi:hypothetical protein